MTQKQHVDIHRKHALRDRMLKHAVPGAAYVPFCGDGDLAVRHYSGRKIYGADIEPARVEVSAERLPSADLRVADCNGWPFPDASDPFAVADLDSYSNPYLSLQSFWQHAPKADRVVIFGTDSYRAAMQQGKHLLQLPDARVVRDFRNGRKQAADPELRAAINFWWPRHVLPWITEAVAPWRITHKSFYWRFLTLYWGIVVGR